MRFAASVLCLLGILSLAPAQLQFPERRDGERIIDLAGIIGEADAALINGMSRESDAYGAPIVVVTIHSVAGMNGRGMSTDEYATRLFNHWQIGDAQINRGMLLLVSVSDRDARIELGGGWGRGHDREVEAIMSGAIIANFKRGLYSRGILEGVHEMSKLAEGKPIRLNTHQDRTQQNALIVVMISGMAAFIILLTIGSRLGWFEPAGRYGGAYHSSWLGSDHDDYWDGGSSGGFGGGSFGGGGGGSSGGGGASGSW